MNNEQHEALWKSVEHYLKQIEKEDVGDVSINGQDCACCDYSILMMNSGHFDCVCCPIAQYTGQELCSGTPYSKTRQAVTIAQNEDPKNREGKELTARENLEVMYRWLVELASGGSPEISIE